MPITISELPKILKELGIKEMLTKRASDPKWLPTGRALQQHSGAIEKMAAEYGYADAPTFRKDLSNIVAQTPLWQHDRALMQRVFGTKGHQPAERLFEGATPKQSKRMVKAQRAEANLEAEAAAGTEERRAASGGIASPEVETSEAQAANIRDAQAPLDRTAAASRQGFRWATRRQLKAEGLAPQSRLPEKMRRQVAEGAEVSPEQLHAVAESSGIDPDELLKQLQEPTDPGDMIESARRWGFDDPAAKVAVVGENLKFADIAHKIPSLGPGGQAKVEDLVARGTLEGVLGRPTKTVRPEAQMQEIGDVVGRPGIGGRVVRSSQSALEDPIPEPPRMPWGDQREQAIQRLTPMPKLGQDQLFDPEQYRNIGQRVVRDEDWTPLDLDDLLAKLGNPDVPGQQTIPGINRADFLPVEEMSMREGERSAIPMRPGVRAPEPPGMTPAGSDYGSVKSAQLDFPQMARHRRRQDLNQLLQALQAAG